ncbi:hypothetical protein Hypma_002577 [Hypsizygus marmoreus]|uniref:Uncharacterized protein n=1 Tax=Hypsizygus marmoreus TaxID=39966 RepID=A0A369J5R4_HYPMA|nr:hypothetical protein Hypma_002577 [Hypsizygus marmoreus]
MGIFAFFSYSTRTVEVSVAGTEKSAVDGPQDSKPRPVEPETKPATTTTGVPALASTNSENPSSSTSPTANGSITPAKAPDSRPMASEPVGKKPTTKAPAEPADPEVKIRRFAFRGFSFTRSHDEHKPVLSKTQEHEKKAHAAAAFSKRFTKPFSSNSNKRAKESALIVRSLIVGPSAASPKLTPASAKPQLNKIKSQLIKPKSANKVIAQLRALPISDAHLPNGKEHTNDNAHPRKPQGPIHAVCLEHSDAEEHKLHFAPLVQDSEAKDQSKQAFYPPGGSPVSIDKISAMFQEMSIIDLIKSPDLGLGQPGDGEGILAGAVPTAETVLNGFQQITPQLMALGYATGKAILPDHAGIFPPTDRMSVLTYWWGLELVLPPPSLEYLANAQSIAGTTVNFLSALSLVNNGVREILPFVRYIAQFIDFEFNSIKAQDKGRGVVCAATWIMPAAMVPRPWDFPDSPEESQEKPSKTSQPVSAPLSDLPVSNPRITVPVAMPSIVDGIVSAYADSVHFQPMASASAVQVK